MSHTDHHYTDRLPRAERRRIDTARGNAAGPHPVRRLGRRMATRSAAKAAALREQTS